jgi:hypothetical protein
LALPWQRTVLSMFHPSEPRCVDFCA